MLVPPIEAVEMRLFFFLQLPMLKRSMIHGSYVYSHLETLAASGFQENLKNFEQHLSNKNYYYCHISDQKENYSEKGIVPKIIQHYHFVFLILPFYWLKGLLHI